VANVAWIKCSDGTSWCPLDMVALGGVTAVGVYVIWHEGAPSRVVRAGQGDIPTRLAVHRNDGDVIFYSQFGRLRVTWAVVPTKADRDGIERYLANHYEPLIGDAWPDVVPIPVNLRQLCTLQAQGL
jgi:hypothetical protein